MRSRRNDDEPMETHLPWADILFKAIARFGVITVIALGLLWFVVVQVNIKLDRIDMNVLRHIQESAWYMRAICVNTATNEAQRASCLPPLAIDSSGAIIPRP